MQVQRQRFKSLELESGKITSNKLIEAHLYQSKFYWLLDCEMDNVELKIENDMLIWLDGTFYWGVWLWGVWKAGNFKAGIWKGGIFMAGSFTGTWLKGVWKGNIFNGNDMSGKITKLQNKTEIVQ